jgi:cell shape-determining protein MreC
MTREIEQLKQQAAVVAELASRLEQIEAQQKAIREMLARVDRRQKKHPGDELARVQF